MNKKTTSSVWSHFNRFARRKVLWPSARAVWDTFPMEQAT